MIAVNLSIQESAYKHIMYLLNSLPKKDIKIIEHKAIEEIDPTALPEDDFDYMSREYLDEMDVLLAKAKANGFKDEL